MKSRRSITIEMIDGDMAAVLRRKTPEQRLTAAFTMWRCARDRLDAMLRAQHPEWDAARHKLEMRRRMIGSE